MSHNNIANIKIEDMIYEMRGRLVILDSSLARLYKFSDGTKYLNKIVKRNLNKFSVSSYFQLTKEELSDLRCQTVTTNLSKSRTLPYGFTEEGVIRLSTILKSESSKKTSQDILNTFERLKAVNLQEVPKIKDLIYELRGYQVMLDSDLAMLYEVETRRINEAVARNKNKFPERFSWILSDEEFDNLRSQIATSSLKSTYGGRRYGIRVFTEQGIAMLATILKSQVAIEISIQIMDAFVTMRKYISTNLFEQKYINDLVLKDNKRIDLLEETFSKFDSKVKINEIYFEGQIYDAYSKLVDIMSLAKDNIIIVDRYADKTVLDMISNLKVSTTLIVKTKSLLKELDILKYKKQYSNLTIVYDDSFHDRYIIIDKSTVYHCGSSINHAGNRTFGVNILEDRLVIENLIDNIEKIIKDCLK